jgi:hypothetical protein
LELLGAKVQRKKKYKQEHVFTSVSEFSAKTFKIFSAENQHNKYSAQTADKCIFALMLPLSICKS